MYNYSKQKCHDGCPKINNGLGYFHIRNSKKIMKIPNINQKDKDAIQKLYFQKLLLFKPWRNENTDLIGDHNSYQIAFENIDADSINADILEIFEISKSRMQSTLIEINKAKITQCKMNLDTETTDLKEQSLGCADYNIGEIDSELLDNKIKSLNKDQRLVFDKINDRINRGNIINEKEIRIFCSGVAGIIIFIVYNSYN